MQTGFVGTIWHKDARRLDDALETAFRAAVLNGPEAERHCDTLSGAALTCLTMPSNRRGSLSPPPAQIYKSDGLLVAADAWLVNAAALSTQLSLPQDTPPAALIGYLYDAHGEAGLDHLNGDFAFVIYDARSETMIARRDPFGVRPLFWAMISGGVAVSTLPEVIPNAGLIEGKRDVDGVLDMITRSAADRPATLTKGLNRVPAGMQMTLSRGDPKPTFRQYWKPQPRTNDVPATFDTWTEELQRLMEKAVQARMPKSGDIAASVSSGLDSTSVVVLAERHLQADQHIFASTYAASEEAEVAYPGMLDETEVAAQVVAGSNHISWEKVRYTKSSGLQGVSIGAAAWSPDVEINPEFMTAIRAAEHGADVILTGWGGDNAVSYKGYGVPAALLKSGKWSSLRALGKREKQNGRSAWKFHAKAALGMVLSEGSPIREFLKGRFRDTRNFNHKLMTGLRPEKLQRGPMNEYRTSDTRANRVKDIMSPVLAFRLEVLACHGLRCGVRYAHPLLDRDLITFALTCPPEYEFRDGMYRAPVRAAMQGILPDVARLRSQTGYPLVEAAVDIAQSKQGLLEKLDELEGDRRLHEWFDFEFIRSHLERLPSVEIAEQHVIEVSKSGQKRPSPVNLSFVAVGSMMSLQTALDQAEVHSSDDKPDAVYGISEM